MQNRYHLKKFYTHDIIRKTKSTWRIMTVEEYRARVAAIRIPLLVSYRGVLLIMAAFGALLTLSYVNFVCKRLFSSYRHEQFLAFFGMLTGTASTGMILLREIDGTHSTPASENHVYRNLPATVFGFPLMFLADFAP